MNKNDLKTNVQKWLLTLMQDPITKILIKNSHLTKAQAETLLIDILSENIADKRLPYEEKARLRLLKNGVSRGAFNRTLRQARDNIIKSIYTVILLGYLGILETPNLEPYFEIAKKLQEYRNAFINLWNKADNMNERLKILNFLRKELEESLNILSRPKSLKRT